jgi:branched-chain amino acid transport system permease protein
MDACARSGQPDLSPRPEPWGRVVRAIREDEDVVKSAGKNVVVYKMQSLALGGAMGSLAGVLLATSQQAVTPDAFIPELTFFAYVIVILGGIGRAYGPIAGALIFWFILAAFDSLLRALAANGALPAALMSGQALGPDVSCS